MPGKFPSEAPDVEDGGTLVVTGVRKINFIGGATVTDKGNREVDVDAGASGLTSQEQVDILVDSPNGHIDNAVLDNGESAEISVPVPNGETLKIYRWGGYRISDGVAPANLNVELKDDGDVVQATANTVNNESTDPNTPVASHTNSSGSLSIFKLAIANDTGGTITDPGVGAIFGYLVE